MACTQLDLSFEIEEKLRYYSYKWKKTKRDTIRKMLKDFKEEENREVVSNGYS